MNLRWQTGDSEYIFSRRLAVEEMKDKMIAKETDVVCKIFFKMDDIWTQLQAKKKKLIGREMLTIKERKSINL